MPPMMVPAWVATALLVFLLAQLAGAATWAIHADRRLALMTHALSSIEAKLDRHDIAVLALKVERLEHESAEHLAAHGRNRQRVEDLRKEVYTLCERATAKPTPRFHGDDS